MVQIRSQQMKALEQAALGPFEDQMVAHSHAFTPRLCEILGDEQLRLALRQAMARAAAYGFTLRGPVRLCIEMMFLFGSGFDSDPQYPWAASILSSDAGQMARAEQLHEQILDYQQHVSGPDAVNTRRALRGLLALARQPGEISSGAFVGELRQRLSDAFPEKAAYIGDDAVTALIHKGRAVARDFSVPTTRGEALLVVLMFGFGHDCSADPLYPWIAQTLTDARIADPRIRVERLEKKAVTWLEHALANLQKDALP